MTRNIGCMAVVGCLVAILARTDAVAFGLHPVQSAILALRGSSVAAPYRLAQCVDECGAVTSRGVAIHARPDPICRGMARRGRRRKLTTASRYLLIAGVGLQIACLGSPVAALGGDLPSKRLREELVDVERARAALAIAVVRTCVSPVRHPVAQVRQIIPGVGGLIP